MTKEDMGFDIKTKIRLERLGRIRRWKTLDGKGCSQELYDMFKGKKKLKWGICFYGARQLLGITLKKGEYAEIVVNAKKGKLNTPRGGVSTQRKE